MTVGHSVEVLEVSHLSVTFGDTHVLSDLSFRVAEGTSLAIIGPNGVGKTVLFRALLGALPFTGSVQWAPGVRIGYVPQSLDLDRSIPITGIDFLRARVSVGRQSPERIPSILDLVGVPLEVAQQPIGTFQGGSSNDC